MDKKALVVLSGGQDSTTCLLWALDKFNEVEAISFNYGQRHKIELKFAEKTVKHFNCEWSLININSFAEIGNSALVDNSIEISDKHPKNNNLPASFVPGRNIILLTLSAAFAYKKNINDIVTGVCETDYSGYPDCRDNTIQLLEKTLKAGMDYWIKIHTPLMFLTKAESWKIAYDSKGEEGIKWIVENTMTCYNGIMDLNEWGRGCGNCPSCKIREKGYREWRMI